MSNENLNDFYNQNRFNKKLRDRIDAFEPELSDSLWDRIEHDLVKKENRNKRAAWLVYVLAGLLLVSSASIYYLANENKKLAEVVKAKEEGDEDKVIPEFTFPETVVERPETDINAPSNANANEMEREQEVTSPAIQVQPQQASGLVQGGNTLNPDAAPEVREMAETPIEIEVSHTAPAENIALTTLKPIAPAKFNYGQKEFNPRFIQENVKKSNRIAPLLSPYFGLAAEYGSNRQLVNGPFAKNFDFEHPGIFRSIGFKTGITHRKGWYIETGFARSETQTNIWYDSVRIKPSGPTPFRIDSVVAGRAAHIVNTQEWIEVPLRIGYLYPINSKLSLNGM
ncbi:MAG: hypothetical protein LPK45_04430, partial [Bacteroidota bacterium]|nr:hypothetical protein [Bacteroidota bacterium]MDX5430301.1 hypothetical protein [Bacteroidota bacterium]MDX5469062.1 hypothetical protein [Bacteroidota bacterium]